jgi:hypothetical protein
VVVAVDKVIQEVVQQALVDLAVGVREDMLILNPHQAEHLDQPILAAAEAVVVVV